ncbi:MAG TPA: hypothetical protein VM364_05145 [Vicinamibacterales bacterium]|nr:hypothetical protein [Vicinamibacterales bacterium]
MFASLICRLPAALRRAAAYAKAFALLEDPPAPPRARSMPSRALRPDPPPPRQRPATILSRSVSAMPHHGRRAVPRRSGTVAPAAQRCTTPLTMRQAPARDVAARRTGRPCGRPVLR